MSPIYDQMHKELSDALSAARMESAGFGFPDDRIAIKSSHFNNQGFQLGQEVHPTEFIVEATRTYRRSWVIGPIERALQMLETNAELLERAMELADALKRVDVERISHLADASRKQAYRG